MSDLEFFSPGEGGESYDPKAFERFKEQMKKNAAFLAAARKGEQKQKQKEDRLARILLKFIQSNQKRGILILASKMLEQNIPPSFILSVILLGDEEIQQELRKEAAFEQPQIDRGSFATPTEFSLALRFSNQTLPIEAKVKIDAWGKGIFEAGSAVPFRVLETATDTEGKIKKITIDCAANVLDDFLRSINIASGIDYESLFSFCEFLMRGVFTSLRKQIESQKELG